MPAGLFLHMLCFRCGIFLLVLRVCCLFLSFKGNRWGKKKIIVLVASNCQARYEIKLEAMIPLFGRGTEMLLVLAAAQLHTVTRCGLAGCTQT